MLEKATEAGIISSKYAYDTLLFVQNNIEHAKNLKWQLSVFEQLSGLRINFHKCDLVPIHFNEDDVPTYPQTFGCKVGRLPTKYLGVPLQYGNLRKEDLQPVVGKIIKRVAGWRVWLLSYGGRPILIRNI